MVSGHSHEDDNHIDLHDCNDDKDYDGEEVKDWMIRNTHSLLLSNFCYWYVLNLPIIQRSEVKDRAAVARRWKKNSFSSSLHFLFFLLEAFVFRLREHVEDPETLPILIFPEGTCINNTRLSHLYFAHSCICILWLHQQYQVVMYHICICILQLSSYLYLKFTFVSAIPGYYICIRIWYFNCICILHSHQQYQVATFVFAFGT